MRIDLNREQYRQLLHAFTIGFMVINDQKNESEIEYDDLEQYLYSLCKDFDSEDLVEYDKEEEYYYPSSLLEEKVLDDVEKFLENNCFENDDEDEEEWEDEDFFGMN